MEFKKVLYYARVKRIEFKDFRNIESGSISFPNADAQSFITGSPSILGLYGQNGSGKSSVIMALGILKDVLSGKCIGNNYSSCIRMGQNYCSLSFEIAMFNRVYDIEGNVANKDYTPYIEVHYSFDISRKVVCGLDDFGNETAKEIFRIENEVMKLKITDRNGTILFPKQVIFDARRSSSDNKGIAFGSEQKYKLFTWGNKEISTQYKSAKMIAEENGTSFLFSPKFENAFARTMELFLNDDGTQSFLEEADKKLSSDSDYHSSVNDIAKNNPEEFSVLSFIFQVYYVLDNLKRFGRSYLQVIDTATTGITNINTQLPLLLWDHDPNGVSFFKLSLQMDKPTYIPDNLFEGASKALASVSDVLTKIVPDMALELVDLGKRINKDNTEAHCFEILSKRNNHTIPLKFESDGIRRMVSILSLLIAVFNEESFTIAIDEIDSGIFEYLLGELLSIMADSISGQFVFTSHNFRALEVLPAKYLCFTTVNPENRFATLSRRGNSNLRDTYFRNIVLGSGKESLYNPTDRYEIERAFYKAGHSGDDMG